VSSDSPRLGRVGSATLLVAGVYGIALVVAGFVVPVYRSTSVSSSGDLADGSDTLVGVNGGGVVLVLGVPLLATVLVACALWSRSRRGALAIAWTLTGLLAAFNLLAMLTIGVFVLPVTAALVLACSTCRRRPEQLGGAAAARSLG
jgi:hypothetical protein